MTRSVVKWTSLAAAAACVMALAAPAQAQETKIVLGMSGWTGFAPLTLADKAGIFKKNGLDVEIKMIPQKDRHLALASKSIQCAATTVETHVAWNANGVPIVVSLLDKAAKGGGWVEYEWAHPQTRKVEPKTTYARQLPDGTGFVGVGVYR